jgi:hypothetical protein
MDFYKFLTESELDDQIASIEAALDDVKGKNREMRERGWQECPCCKGTGRVDVMYGGPPASWIRQNELERELQTLQRQKMVKDGKN